MPKKKFSVPFVEQDDFGTLCICALRYCMGRQTYMPSLVRGIIRPLLPLLSNKDISVLIQDCDFQKKYDMYGDATIDKPGWIEWEQEVIAEKARRETEASE